MMNYGSGQKKATHGGNMTDAKKSSTRTMADDGKHQVGAHATGKKMIGTSTGTGSNANVVASKAKSAC